MLAQGDVEREAAALLRAAKLSGVPGGPRIARALGFDVVRVPQLVVPACLATVAGRPTVVIRESLSPREAHFSICHEVAEAHLARLGHRGPAVEEDANALGAALLMPVEPFAHAAEHRKSWAQLALDFSATETAVALRAGETTHRPLAVVAPHRVRVRGAWADPIDEEQARRLARRPGPGLVAARLRDDRRRVVLVVR